MIRWRWDVPTAPVRVLLAGVLAASGMLSLAAVASHAASSPSLTVVAPAASAKNVGDVFTVVVNMNTNGTQITGWQFGFSYDPTVLELQGASGAQIAGNNLPLAATYGSPSFLDTFAPTNGTAGSVAMKLTALGTVQPGGQALSGQNANTGANGASPPALATFTFKALASGTSGFTFDRLKVTDVNAAAISGVTVSPTSPSITIGGGATNTPTATPPTATATSTPTPTSTPAPGTSTPTPTPPPACGSDAHPVLPNTSMTMSRNLQQGVGDIIVLNVTLDTGSVQSFGMQFGLTYDPTIIVVDSITKGPFYGDSSSVKAWDLSTQGNIPVGGVTLLGSAAGITGSGPVAVITSHAVGVGSTTLTLTCAADSVLNDAGTATTSRPPATLGNVSVTVSPALTPTPAGTSTLTPTPAPTPSLTPIATVTLDNKTVNLGDAFTMDLSVSNLQSGLVLRGAGFGVTSSPQGVVKVTSVSIGSAFTTFAAGSHGLTSAAIIPAFKIDSGGNVPNPGGILLTTASGPIGVGPTSGVIATLHLTAAAAGTANVRLLLFETHRDGTTLTSLDQISLAAQTVATGGGVSNQVSGGATLVGGKVTVGTGGSTVTPTSTATGATLTPTRTVTATTNSTATVTATASVTLSPTVTPTPAPTTFATYTPVATTVSVGGTSVPTPTPPAVGNTALNFSPAAATPATGENFKVNVSINTSLQVRGIEFGLVFDPRVVQVDSVDPGPMLTAWADANGASVTTLPSFTIDNGAGKVTQGGLTLLGGDGGPTGSGTLAIVSLHAIGEGTSPLVSTDVGVTVPWYTLVDVQSTLPKTWTLFGVPFNGGQVLVGASAQQTATAAATLTPQATATTGAGTPTPTLNPTQQAAATTTTGAPAGAVASTIGNTPGAPGTTGSTTTGQPGSATTEQTVGGQATTGSQGTGAAPGPAGPVIAPGAATTGGARPAAPGAAAARPAGATGAQPGAAAGTPGPDSNTTNPNQPVLNGTPGPAGQGPAAQSPAQGPRPGQTPGAPQATGVRAAATPAVVTFDLGTAVDARGVISQDVRMASPDDSVRVLIAAGTVALTNDKRPVRTIQFTVSDDLPVVPDDVFVAGRGFEFGPTGATFNPPITVSLPYDPSAIPDTMAEDNVEPAFFDTKGGTWVSLGGAVDPTARTVTAQISHFTTFAVLTKRGGVNWMLLAGIILSELGVGAIAALMLQRWRRRGGALLLPWRLPLRWPRRTPAAKLARPVSRDERLWGRPAQPGGDPTAHSTA